MTEAGPSAIRRLAARVGIVPEYVDQTGTEIRATSDATRRDLLAAMGFDASTAAAARAALAALRASERRELIAPVVVAESGDPAARALDVRVPSGRARAGSWRLEVHREAGDRDVIEGGWPDDTYLRIPLPDLPIGYHTLRLETSGAGDESCFEQSRIVVPPRCVTPDALLGGHGSFGLTSNLYTVRSATNWGIGDLSDLAALAGWGGSIGADFVGVNPLHALLNRGDDISPYSPVSRLFRNPIYIDVAKVPELVHAPAVRDRLASPELAAELEALRESANVRYDQVMAVKGLALDALHRVFAESVRDSGDARARAYEEFIAAGGLALDRFALWMAIAERHGTDWRRWPDALRDSTGEAARQFAAENSPRVDFHRWLQFETDRQLGEAARSAREAGMRIGLYQDLAIGTSPAGADAWAFPDLFARGASVGAPPDSYSATGQNWGIPPIDPHAMRRDRYRYFIDLVRGGFRHAGAVRIDHVLGFFRLFWIPEGRSGDFGAYVRYPSHDLLGIVALESVRNNALVVGEDLGTVPRDVPRALEKWGVLSSKVLVFERDKRGGFKSSKTYPELSLATANTHDMAPIAGFWTESDIDARRKVGLIDDHEAERERVQRDADRGALLDRLAKEKVLPRATAPESGAELRGAVHAFLCRSPARLVGLSLDDLAGETEPVNVPGVGPDRYRSWSRKMREPLEVIVASSDTAAALRCDGRRGVREA